MRFLYSTPAIIVDADHVDLRTTVVCRPNPTLIPRCSTRECRFLRYTCNRTVDQNIVVFIRTQQTSKVTNHTTILVDSLSPAPTPSAWIPFTAVGPSPQHQTRPNIVYHPLRLPLRPYCEQSTESPLFECKIA